MPLFTYSFPVDVCVCFFFPSEMSCVENIPPGVLVIYRQLFVFCAESEVRTVCSPNQGPYWSMSVFVSVPVCVLTAQHVVSTRSNTHGQTCKHSMVCRCTELTAGTNTQIALCSISYSSDFLRNEMHVLTRYPGGVRRREHVSEGEMG